MLCLYFDDNGSNFWSVKSTIYESRTARYIIYGKQVSTQTKDSWIFGCPHFWFTLAFELSLNLPFGIICYQQIDFQFETWHQKNDWGTAVHDGKAIFKFICGWNIGLQCPTHNRQAILKTMSFAKFSKSGKGTLDFNWRSTKITQSELISETSSVFKRHFLEKLIVSWPIWHRFEQR